MESIPVLPDELWRRIMEIGIQSKAIDYRSLCCLSIASRCFHRLADDDSLWSFLLFSDYPSSSEWKLITHENRNSSSTGNGNNKNLYKARYKKDREQKRLAHRRVVLRIESQIAQCMRKIRELELQSSEEKEKMKSSVAELLNLRKISQASVALNVWQPEIVWGRQRQMVEQSNVPVNFRVNALQMELKLCKQQIAGFDLALRLEKRRLHAAKEQLASAMYHPLQDSSCTITEQKECTSRTKKLKHVTSSNAFEKQRQFLGIGQSKLQ